MVKSRSPERGLSRRAVWQAAQGLRSARRRSGATARRGRSGSLRSSISPSLKPRTTTKGMIDGPLGRREAEEGADMAATPGRLADVAVVVGPGGDLARLALYRDVEGGPPLPVVRGGAVAAVPDLAGGVVLEAALGVQRGERRLAGSGRSRPRRGGARGRRVLGSWLHLLYIRYLITYKKADMNRKTRSQAGRPSRARRGQARAGGPPGLPGAPGQRRGAGGHGAGAGRSRRHAGRSSRC